MQVKLLRVIQEKTVRPIGEQREVPVDVRVLSATHKNLAELVAQGRFREDLFYRINVIEMRVPALREHAEDIPELADAMLQRLAARSGAQLPTLSAEDARCAAALCLSGQRARTGEHPGARHRPVASGVIDVDGPAATPAARRTGSELRSPAPGSAQATCSRRGQRRGQRRERAAATALGDQLENMERAAIVKALEKTRYNKTAAAKLLGMSFRALRYRIKKLGIE